MDANDIQCKAREEYHHEERERESCSESLVASCGCTGMGSPAHLMMSGPVSSRRVIKEGLSRENGHFSGNSPLDQISLQPTNQQQRPNQTSPPLSYLEKEAIRTCGRPWRGPPATRLSEKDWYPVWKTFQRMGERKGKIIRCLDF